MIVVTFYESRSGTPVTFINKKVAFPECGGIQPAIGETWQAYIVGSNPAGTVDFLKLMNKVSMVDWHWNNGITKRSRRPACLIVTPQGDVYRFQGTHISGVVTVVNATVVENGRWSNTTFFCKSPEGTNIYSFQESYDEGSFWPQSSWQKAYTAVAKEAPQTKLESFKDAVRAHWPKSAEKFDCNDRAAKLMRSACRKL